MFLTYLGHSAVYFGNHEYQVVIDPFITNNPQTDVSLESIQVTHVLVTHGHEDHLGDAIALCLRTQAVFIANYEICQYAQEAGVATTVALNIGGKVQTAFGSVKLVTAVHSSTIQTPTGEQRPAGLAGGFVVEFFHRRFYHAGDTALTLDMKLLKSKKTRFDIAFLPIGGTYTMDYQEAIIATKWIKPKVVIPIHYDTFPEIKQSVKPFERAFKKGKTLCKVMKPGMTIRGSYEKLRLNE
ncbi:MAG: metal-dependent hydrolase [Culicoidibacterales bacterium]